MARVQHLNSFDITRFIAAIMVIYSHSFALSGNKQPRVGDMTIGAIGVWIFFILSGYLITASWKQYPRFNVFMAKRSLRIFPALIVVILLSIFILSFFSSLSYKDYFKNQLTLSYLNNILLFNPSPALPGVFESNIHTSGINGSLATLPYEFTMYISVAILGVLSILRKNLVKTIWLILLLLNFIYILSPDSLSFFLFYLHINLFIQLGLMFFTGVLLQMYDVNIKYKWNFWIPSLFLFALGALLLPSAVTIFGATLLAYGVLGFCKLPTFSKFGIYGDFSYGLYIYAFPIQQVIYQTTQTRNSLKMFALSFVLSLFFAALSWSLIESKFIKLKKRIRHEDYPISEKRAELSHAW